MSVPANIVNQQGQGVVPADQLNTFILGGSMLANLQGFTGVSNMMIALLGFTQPNDGGQGLFYYVSSGSYTADNVNVVVPNGATQGAWIRVQLSGSASPSLVSTVFPNLAAAEAATLTSSAKAITILGYAAVGDAPPRTMVSIPAPAVSEPWYVRTADGGYWEDSGGDFWVEWLGAITSAADCSTALNNAFLAHLHLGMVLRGKGTKNCTNQVYWNPSGFATRFCWADFNGEGDAGSPGGGMCIEFSANVTAPCFGLYSSTSQSEIYGKFRGIEIRGNTNGLMAQLGRTDYADDMNDFNVHLVVANASTGTSAAVIQVNGMTTNQSVYLQANGGSPGTVPSGPLPGLYALQLNQVSANNITPAVSAMNVGIQVTGSSNIVFPVGEIAFCYIGYQSYDSFCNYNTIMGIDFSSCTYPIDNHLTFVNGGATGATLRLVNPHIAITTHLFYNPAAIDDTWGGIGVVLDTTGTLTAPDFTPPLGSALPATGTWTLNKGAVAYSVSIFGSSSGHNVSFNVGSWNYFNNSNYATVSEIVPCTFVIGAGEIVQTNFDGGSYTWTWRPLVTL